MARSFTSVTIMSPGRFVPERGSKELLHPRLGPVRVMEPRGRTRHRGAARRGSTPPRLRSPRHLRGRRPSEPPRAERSEQSTATRIRSRGFIIGPARRWRGGVDLGDDQHGELAAVRHLPSDAAKVCVAVRPLPAGHRHDDVAHAVAVVQERLGRATPLDQAPRGVGWELVEHVQSGAQPPVCAPGGQRGGGAASTGRNEPKAMAQDVAVEKDGFRFLGLVDRDEKR